MFKNILVPLDGSPFGEQALRYAILVAAATGARVHLVIVAADRAGGSHVSPAQQYIETAVEFVSSELDESVSFSVLSSGVAARTRTRIAEVLHDYIHANDIDLVVMTTHGRGTVTRSWMGSVADGVVRMSPVPVLLIRPRRTRKPRAALGRQKLARIVISLDGSRASEAAIEPSLKLAHALKAEITLLHVTQTLPVAVQPESYMAYEVNDQFADREQDPRSYLDSVMERLEREGVNVHATTVSAIDVPHEIKSFANKHGAGILALSTSGWSAPLRWLLGSTADKIVRTSDIPVLIVSPEGASKRVEPGLAPSGGFAAFGL